MQGDGKKVFQTKEREVSSEKKGMQETRGYEECGFFKRGNNFRENRINEKN